MNFISVINVYSIVALSINTDKDQLQYPLSSSSVSPSLSPPPSSLSLVVPVQVATTVVAMNTDHPEWTLPITVDYLFESPQG
jgi:hypothetical protein